MKNCAKTDICRDEKVTRFRDAYMRLKACAKLLGMDVGCDDPGAPSFNRRVFKGVKYYGNITPYGRIAVQR